MRDAIHHLKELVRKQVIDIRKVDKGKVILIINYVQRKKAEELNVSEIAKLSNIQSFNWEEFYKFISNSRL